MKLNSHFQLFEKAQLAITNTQRSAELNKRMSAYGFTPERMQEGQGILDRARSFYDTKRDRYHERQRIGNRLNADRETVYATFRDHVATARLAFRHDPETLNLLNIRKIVNIRSWQWTAQAETFYQQVSQHTKEMAKYQVKANELQQAQASVEALVALKGQRQQVKADAEEATRMKNEALRELRQWLRDFHAVARIATQDVPQLREAYGVVVRA